MATTNKVAVRTDGVTSSSTQPEDPRFHWLTTDSSTSSVRNVAARQCMTTRKRFTKPSKRTVLDEGRAW